MPSSFKIHDLVTEKSQDHGIIAEVIDVFDPHKMDIENWFCEIEYEINGLKLKTVLHESRLISAGAREIAR